MQINNTCFNIIKKYTSFDIELEETILFPEGGGQPCDKGTIDNKHVKKVIRVGAKVCLLH